LKKITVFSGNRAEFGLLSPILKALSKSKKIKLFFIVSGSHLYKNFGYTINEVLKENIKINEKFYIKNKIKNDTTSGYTPLNIAEIIKGYTNILIKIKPDFNLVYADRFESFASAISSSQMNIPTIHVEGGDKTEGGTLDDSVRHAITKLSHFHIVTNRDAFNRVLKLGEERWRIKNFGYSLIDSVRQKNYASKIELEKKLKIKIARPIIIFTYHPISINLKNAILDLKICLRALTKLSKDYQVIITYPNIDYGSQFFISEINKNKNFKNIKIFRSLGRYYYHGILSLIKKEKIKVLCMGNSSSGIKETAIFKCPSINLGKRQNGRLKSTNVFNVAINQKKIINQTNKCFSNKKIINIINKSKNLYGGGRTGEKILKFIEEIKYSKSKMLEKKIKY
jgi:UDP-N-acetylglucosamine 2-epimerase (non-hydrolysing)/GDP/UDP-N,N'-diacetylbacillosamine 2-epimerase (hydrolysing)